MFGATHDADGKNLLEQNSPILTGLHVTGNELMSLTMGKDQAGNPDPRFANLMIKQSNGSELKHTIWAPNDEKGVTRTNTFILHLCSAFVTPEEYKALVGSPSSFEEFVNVVGTNVFPKAKGVKFTMTIIKKENTNSGKWYAQLPGFPPFVEKDGTTPTGLYMKKSYVFETPATTDMGTAKKEELPQATVNDLF